MAKDEQAKPEDESVEASEDAPTDTEESPEAVAPAAKRGAGGSAGDSERASASDADAEAEAPTKDADSDEPNAAASSEDRPAAKPKKKKKKRKPAAAGAARPERKKKPAASTARAARKDEPEENATPLIIGAVFVAAAAVAGLWFWNNRGTSETSEVTIEDVDDREEAPPRDRPVNPFAEAAQKQPPRPGAIPAPPDVAAPPEDAQRTESGLASKVLEEGTGTDHPSESDRVTVHYTGWTTDGRMFDSSIPRGEPATLPLNGVIDGWTEGVQLMVAGEKRRFWIPAELAYRGRPGAPPGMLVFDIELVEFEATPEPPPAPSDVAGPPRNAQRTASGLASRVLERGSGTEHPSPTDRVSVHYTGWTTDGEMFDSSITRGQPATFPLNRVIPGWTEGVQLMVVGEKRRFWIPEELAYGGRPGAPQGMLVFDVELLEIQSGPPGGRPPIPGAPR